MDATTRGSAQDAIQGLFRCKIMMFSRNGQIRQLCNRQLECCTETSGLSLCWSVFLFCLFLFSFWFLSLFFFFPLFIIICLFVVIFFFFRFSFGITYKCTFQLISNFCNYMHIEVAQTLKIQYTYSASLKLIDYHRIWLRVNYPVGSTLSKNVIFD